MKSLLQNEGQFCSDGPVAFRSRGIRLGLHYG